MAIIGTGGGNASFSQLENHIAAGGNITTGWNVSTQVLTVSATGFTGNNIAGASDVTVTSVVSGHILIRNAANNAWVNQSVQGDLRVNASGNFQIQSNTIGPGELIVSGNGSAGQHLQSNGTGGLQWADQPSVRAGDNIRISTSGLVTTVSGNTISAGANITVNTANGVTTISGQAAGGGSTFTRSDISSGTGIELIQSGSQGVVISSTLSGRRSDAEFANSVLSTLSAGSNISLTKAGNVITVSSTATGGGGASSLNDLSDVDTGNTNAAGQLLILDTSVTPDTFYNYAMSGDVSMTYSGVVTITSNAITSGKIASGAVTLAKINVGSNNSGKVLKVNAAGNAAEWGTDDTAAGGSGITRANILAGGGITTTNSGASNVVIASNAGKTQRFIDFGNDTTDDIAVGKFVAGLDGFDGNGDFIGEEADASTKVPVGISVLAIDGKESNNSDANVVKRSVFVEGPYNVPSSDIDGSLASAVDRQAVYLKWVTNQWKVTLERTKWMVGTHHNGDVIFNFTGLHSSQDFADQILNTVDDFSGDISRTQDSMLVGDNGTVKEIDWNVFEAVVEPIHTRQKLSLTGYRYSAQSPSDHTLQAGEFHLVASDLNNVSLQGVAKAGEEEEFKALMSEGFQLEIETGTGNNRIWVVGVVGTSAVAGNAVQVNFVAGSVTKSTGNFSNDVTLTFNSYGRHPNWNSVEFERVPSDGYSSRKLASTQWTRNFFLDQEATVAEAASGANVDKFISPSVNNQTFLLLNGSSEVTGMSALATNGIPSSDKQFVWSTNTYLMNLSATTYAGVASRLQPGFRYEIKNGGGTVVERGLIASASRSGTSVTLVPVANTVWSTSSTHRGTAGTGYEFRFVGAAAYSGEQREREKIQSCQCAYVSNENTATDTLAGNVIYKSTFGTGNSRVGRMGNAITGRLINNTQCEHLGSGHLGFRAITGYIYDVVMLVGGVYNFSNATPANSHYGMEIGLQYSQKATNTSTWGSWNDCNNSDSTSGTFTYDKSNFGVVDGGGNAMTLERDNRASASKILSLLRTKWISGGVQNWLDTAVPISMVFSVGGSQSPFRNTANMDIRFRPVYAATNGTIPINAVYGTNGSLRAIRNE